MPNNIVFIFPDQLRADFLGCYGAAFAKTPHIDQLAHQGTQYQAAVSATPACVPARASMLTGHNSVVNGVLNNMAWLRPDHEACGLRAWPKLLSNAGYETVAIGKMHFYPWDSHEGFETRIISEDKRHDLVEDDYCDYLAGKSLKKYSGKHELDYYSQKGAIVNPFPPEDQADTWITRETCHYLEQRNDERPFALMVGLLSPHCPYDPDKDSLALFDDVDIPDALPENEESQKLQPTFLNRYRKPWSDIDYATFTDEEKRRLRKHYSASIYEVDKCVGQILDTLEKTGLRENTTVIFASDHGDYMGDFGRIGKHEFHEASVHVPLIVHSPGQAPGVVTNPVSLCDIRATMLDIGGVAICETPDSKKLPLTDAPTPHRVIFGAMDGGMMLRCGRFKFVKYRNGLVQLFDLETDPSEQRNLAENPDYTHCKTELDAKLTVCLLESITLGNQEKTVDMTTDMEPGAFFKRNWNRPYPVQISNEF